MAQYGLQSRVVQAAGPVRRASRRGAVEAGLRGLVKDGPWYIGNDRLVEPEMLEDVCPDIFSHLWQFKPDACVTVVHICLNNTYHVHYSDQAWPYGLTDRLVLLTVHTIAWPNDATGSLYQFFQQPLPNAPVPHAQHRVSIRS